MTPGGTSRLRRYPRARACKKRVASTKRRARKNVITCDETSSGDHMPVVRVGNALCSWGTLEFEEAKAEQIGYGRMYETSQPSRTKQGCRSAGKNSASHQPWTNIGGKKQVVEFKAATQR